MPHTTTGKKRSKRPDVRPNGKERRKEKQKVAAATPVEKLIKTRIHSSQRKERPVSGILRKENQQIDTVSKIIRSRQKVLKQIASLAEKQKSGTILDKAQIQKLGRFDIVVAELEELLGRDSHEPDHVISEGEDDEIEDEEEIGTINEGKDRESKKSKYNSNSKIEKLQRRRTK